MTVPNVGPFTSTGAQDFFVARFNAELVAMACDTYGGNVANNDGGLAVAVGPSGDVWVTGKLSHVKIMQSCRMV